MKQIKFNDGTLFDCIAVYGRKVGERICIDMLLNATYADVITKFVNDAQYGVLEEEIIPATGEQTEDTVTTTLYDKSDYCVAGAITDNRNGTVNVFMGKKTDLELANDALDEMILASLEVE